MSCASRPARPMVGSAEEPLIFLAVHGPYQGALPAFYETSELAAATALERNFESIRDEVVNLLRDDPQAWRTPFTPGGYHEPKWRSLNLETNRVQFHRNRRKLPRTAAIIDSLPGVTFAQVGILEPGCELIEHHGDHNGSYRLHLGLEIPGQLPDLGIDVAGERRGWRVGEVLAFEDAHQHSVWNHTELPRIVLLVDVIKDEIADRRARVCARASAGIVIQLLDAKIPMVQRLPNPARHCMLSIGTAFAWVLTPLERRLGVLLSAPARLRVRGLTR